MKTYPYLSNNDKKAIDNLFLNLKKHPGSQKIWGEGEIRLLITK